MELLRRGRQSGKASCRGRSQLYLEWVQKKWSLGGQGGKVHSDTGTGVLEQSVCVYVSV